jgi:hypothetical protein
MKTLIITTAIAIGLISPLHGERGSSNERDLISQDHFSLLAPVKDAGPDIEAWMSDADYFYPLVKDASPATEAWMSDADYFYPLVKDASPTTEAWMSDADYFYPLVKDASPTTEAWMSDADYFYPAALTPLADPGTSTQPWMINSEYFYPSALVPLNDPGVTIEKWMIDTNYFYRSSDCEDIKKDLPVRSKTGIPESPLTSVIPACKIQKGKDTIPPSIEIL